MMMGANKELNRFVLEDHLLDFGRFFEEVNDESLDIDLKVLLKYYEAKYERAFATFEELIKQGKIT